MERASGAGAQRKPKAESGVRPVRKTLWQTSPHSKQKVTLEKVEIGSALKAIIVTNPNPAQFQNRLTQPLPSLIPH